MNKKRSITFLSTIAVFIATIFIAVGTRNAFATASSNLSPVYKVLLKDVYSCYSNNAFKDTVNISDIQNQSSGSSTVSYLMQSPGTLVTIPNGLIGSLGNDTRQITCEELLNGKNTLFNGDSSGLIKNPSAIPSVASSAAEVEKFLKTFGYEPDAEANKNKRCFQYLYDYHEYTDPALLGAYDNGVVARYTDYICVDVNSAGQITSNATIMKSSASTDIVQFELKHDGAIIQLDCATWAFGDGGCGSFKVADYSYKELQDKILAELGGKNISKSYTYSPCTGGDLFCSLFNPTQYYVYTLNNTEETPVSENDNNKWNLLESNPAGPLLTALSGNHNPPIIYKNDVAQLYVTYLLNYYSAKQVCGLSEQQIIIYTGAAYNAIPYRDNAEGQQCYVYSEAMRNNKDFKDSVNGMRLITDSLGYAIGKDTDNFESIVAWLIKYNGSVDVDLATATALDPEQQTPGSSGTTGDSDFESAKCYDNAGPMGWVLCPIVSGLQDIMNSVYGWIETNYLQVNPNFFSGGNNGLRGAWGAFRDIANVVFVILILVVIFSQVTGVGIDNYGIKKILPRLIIGAVLMNLSFIICMLLADLSNIAGNGLNSMLSSSFGIESGVTISGSSQGVATIFVGATSLATIVALLFVNPGLIITALIGLLSAAIAILFLWVILVARQAAIILGIVISPLAFVCYLLPNTEKWFKKWVSLMGGLLLLYPLCGLVIGGGRFASNVLSQIGDFSDNGALGLAALLIQVIPYFFIPTLLKSSLNVVGNLGTKLSGIGKTLGSTASKGIKNTDAYKEHQLRSRAGLDKNGRETWRGRMLSNYKGPGARTLNRQRTRAGASLNKIRQDDINAMKFLRQKDNAYDEAHGTSMDKAGWERYLTELAQGDDDKAFYAAIETSRTVLGKSKSHEAVRKAIMAADAANKGFMGEHRSDNLRTLSSMGYLDVDAVMKNWADQGGGIGKNAMTLDNYEGNTRIRKDGNNDKDNMAAISDPLKTNQIPALTKKVLERNIFNGNLSQEEALQAVRDPDNKFDAATRLMLAAYGVDGEKILSDDAEVWASSKNASRQTWKSEKGNAAYRVGVGQEYTLSAAASEYIKPQPMEVDVVQKLALYKDKNGAQKTPVHVDFMGGESTTPPPPEASTTPPPPEVSTSTPPSAPTLPGAPSIPASDSAPTIITSTPPAQPRPTLTPSSNLENIRADLEEYNRLNNNRNNHP